MIVQSIGAQQAHVWTGLSSDAPLAPAADGVEVSPPGGVLVRRAPGTAAVDFGQTIRLSPAWRACTAGGRRRSSLQHGGTRQPAPGSQAGQPQPLQPLASHSESMAWVCSLPDPAAALQYLQRAALLSRAAGPGGPLVAQPSENFATPLPCGFK